MKFDDIDLVLLVARLMELRYETTQRDVYEEREREKERLGESLKFNYIP